MLRHLKFKNFYSFNEEGTINFLVNGNAPETDAYFDCSNNERLTKLLAIIGPNASGKTNVLKALAFLKWLIADSFELKPEDSIPFKPFYPNAKLNLKTSLSVEFELEKVFRYTIELDIHRIFTEKLEICNQSKVLFERSWDEGKNKYRIKEDGFFLPEGFEKVIRANASVFATARQFNHELSSEIVEYWDSMVNNVIESGPQKNYYDDMKDVAEFFDRNPDLREKATALLKKFDLGLSSLNILKLSRNKNKDDLKKEEEEFVYLPEAVHNFNGDSYKLPFFYESSGTLNLFQLLAKILTALKNGSVAILDEFDANLHPSMLPELADLFLSKNYNTKNAQLIFSTHHPQILNRLDKYQIVFVEKNEQGASEAWRLDEIQGVRSDDNYYAKYIAGAYGAVPKI